MHLGEVAFPQEVVPSTLVDRNDVNTNNVIDSPPSTCDTEFPPPPTPLTYV